MKKYTIILLLLCLTSMMDANAGHRGHHPGQACQYLKIIIKNDTPFHCYMIKRTLKMGDIYETYNSAMADELEEISFTIHYESIYKICQNKCIIVSFNDKTCNNDTNRFDRNAKAFTENFARYKNRYTLWKTDYSPMDRCEQTKKMISTLPYYNKMFVDLECIKVNKIACSR